MANTFIELGEKYRWGNEIGFYFSVSIVNQFNKFVLL